MTFTSLADVLGRSIDNLNEAYSRESGLSGISSGFRDLDAKLGGLHGGQLIVIAGRPSMGKTALATNIAFNVAREGAVVGFFSLEMKARWVADRILADQAGVAADRIRRGLINETEFKRLVEATSHIATMSLLIHDETGITITDIAERARRLRSEKGLNLLVLDYVQLVQGGERQGEGRFQEIQEITAGLKALAMELSIPIIAVSQLSRGLENREDKRPVLTDLLGAGSLENDADVVLFVFRQDYYVERWKPEEGTPEFQEWMTRLQQIYGKAEVIIGKQRHGPVGTVDLQFEASVTRFSGIPNRQGTP